MSVAKIAISIDEQLLERLDAFIAQKKFKTRSQAFQVAVTKTMEQLDHRRLIDACAKLNPVVEQQMADEGLLKDSEAWPEF
jgi:metal-responsive CopG/Arc/MetJ family transcriptional regulator